MNAELHTQVDHDNSARAEIEFYEILATRPERFVAYMGTGCVTLWTGKVIGRVTHTGTKVRQGGFTSSCRQYVRVTLHNGDTYGGWSLGTNMYIKLRKVSKVSK